MNINNYASSHMDRILYVQFFCEYKQVWALTMHGCDFFLRNMQSVELGLALN